MNILGPSKSFSYSVWKVKIYNTLKTPANMVVRFIEGVVLCVLQFRPVMIGDISSSGSFTALFLHQLGPCKVKLNAQVSTLA